MQRSRTTPSVRAMVSPGKPVSAPALRTGGTAASFMPASIRRNATTSALMEKPIHHILPRLFILTLPSGRQMLAAMVLSGLVQERQLPFPARDVAGSESDEPAQRPREMGLIE